MRHFDCGKMRHFESGITLPAALDFARGPEYPFRMRPGLRAEKANYYPSQRYPAPLRVEKILIPAKIWPF